MPSNPSTAAVARHRGSPAAQHGRLGDASWTAPRLTTRSDAVARPGYNSKKANEYLDEPDVLRAKVRVLARLLRASRHTVVYAGAGLSTSAGIGDYASKSIKESSVAFNTPQHREAAKRPSKLLAKPSAGHKAIAALAREGLVARFVQQNHDGLPQKAGMPQRLINEIHGAWFDPSNPVVPMDGSLRTDLFEDLCELEERADLVLTVGSSLCGMNADRLVETCNARADTPDRSRRSTSWWMRFFGGGDGEGREDGPSDGAAAAAAAGGGGEGGGGRGGASAGEADTRVGTLGAVIVSLQRTPHDESCGLRIFALIDDVMMLLLGELGLDAQAIVEQQGSLPRAPAAFEPQRDVFLVPYDARGNLVQAAAGEGPPRLELDLREGALLTVTDGPLKGARAKVLGKNQQGHYRLSIHARDKKTGKVMPTCRLLGKWWMTEAVAGEVGRLPVVPRALEEPAAVKGNKPTSGQAA